MVNLETDDAKTDNDDGAMGTDSETWNPESFWSSMDEDTKTFVENEYDKAEKCVARKKWSKGDQAKIKNASIEELENMMQEYMNQATQEQDKFEQNASRGARAEREMMKFLDKFNGYVQAYKGAVDVMKGAGFGGGEAAYGALQLFLVTAVNKQKIEDFIIKMLVELSQQYDRLQRLKPAYPTQEMQKHRAVLYRLGVEFLHESVRYFAMSPLRRLGHLFARPSSIGVQRIVDDIKSAIRETEREMRAIDGGRINQIERTQWQIVRQQKEDRMALEEANTILTALQNRNDNDRLDMLRRLLHLDASNDSVDLERYGESLREAFFYLKRLPPLDVDEQVFNRPEFHRWKQGAVSSIFFLHGATIAPEQTVHSWLSPAAVQLVSTFSSVFGIQQGKESSTLLSHYLYRSPDTVSSTQEKTSPVVAISSIIHQILRSEKGKRIIRNEDSFAFLRQSIDALENTSATKQIRARCRTLIDVLHNVLKELDVKCLVIVIDRIDKFQLGIENAMELLVELTERAKTTVKIFVTARSRADFDDEDWKERLGGQYMRLRINQGD